MARNQDRRRKLEQKAKKAAKRRQQRRQDADHFSRSLGATRGLDEAEELFANGEIGPAVEVLDELSRRYPRDLEILARLAEVHQHTSDSWAFQEICQRITVAAPDEPIWWLALASAALLNGQPATAVRSFAHFTAAWPNHPETPRAQQMQQSLQEFLAGEYRIRGWKERAGLQILLLHDEINLYLNRHKYDQVCDSAARLLAMCPTFAPALNNRSEAHFRSGRYVEAIADSRRVLQFDATNYHALANLTRYLYLFGRFDEAQQSATALKECEAHEGDAFLKKAEVFTILGDWEAVRQAVHDGQDAWATRGETPGLAEHLAGVAAANLGDLKAARQHWRRAIDALDNVDWAT
jgi:tetratricopeptide (TPR) repeat protein